MQADFVVFLAVARRGVHRAGPCFQGHMVAQDHEGIAVDEGMARFQPFELLAFELFDDLVVLDAELLQRLFKKPFGQDQHLVRSVSTAT